MIPEYTSCQEGCSGIPFFTVLMTVYRVTQRQATKSLYCHLKLPSTAGLGVIDNDFHDRKDLTPNVCAVYTEDEHRKKGLAGKLLNRVVEDMKNKGIEPLYLITDHIGFYERYGWEFLCMVQGDDEPEMTRMYIHR